MTERWKLRVLLAGTLGVATVVMLGLPAILLTLPDPGPRTVVSVAQAGRGAYARGDATTWRLFPRAEPADRLPPDAPAMHAPVELVVAARQAGDPAAYVVRRLDGAALPLAAKTERCGRLTLVVIGVTGLASGSYELSLPRESMYGGTDFVYFSVSR